MQKINEYIRNWPMLSDEEKENVKKEVSEQDYCYITETHKKMGDYKKAILSDEDILQRMKSTVYNHVGENYYTRKELEKEIELDYNKGMTK